MPDPLDEALAAAVTATGGRGATLDMLRATAFATDPDLAGAPDQRARLAAVFRRLGEAGIAVLPVSRAGWDRTGDPPLPLRLRRPASQRPRPARPAIPAGLRPELAAAHHLQRPTAEEIDVLTIVNRYLRDRPADQPSVPVRVRSHELFGDEKRLDRIARWRLFRDGILSFDLLDCYTVHPPFVWRRVGPGPDLLVAENHHTYALLADSLRTRPRPLVGRLAYGAGEQFYRSVSFVADLDELPGIVWYFGDLDGNGLAIPSRAAGVAGTMGLPPVRPAAGLYRALLTWGIPQATGPVGAADAASLTAWLPDSLGPDVAELLTAGRRIAQEALGRAVDRIADWLT